MYMLIHSTYTSDNRKYVDFLRSLNFHCQPHEMRSNLHLINVIVNNVTEFTVMGKIHCKAKHTAIARIISCFWLQVFVSIAFVVSEKRTNKQKERTHTDERVRA